METVLTIIHYLICFFLIIVVLLQSGKAADLAGAFGGMGSQTAFGPRGSATLLSKATTGAAVVFMVTSLTLAIMATRRAGLGTTVLEERRAPVTTPAQKAPAPVAPAPGVPVQIPPGAPGGAQPSVTLSNEGGGPSKTIPLDLNKLPRVDPKTGKIMPSAEEERQRQQQQQPAPKK